MNPNFAVTSTWNQGLTRQYDEEENAEFEMARNDYISNPRQTLSEVHDHGAHPLQNDYHDEIDYGDDPTDDEPLEGSLDGDLSELYSIQSNQPLHQNIKPNKAPMMPKLERPENHPFASFSQKADYWLNNTPIKDPVFPKLQPTTPAFTPASGSSFRLPQISPFSSIDFTRPIYSPTNPRSQYNDPGGPLDNSIHGDDPRDLVARIHNSGTTAPKSLYEKARLKEKIQPSTGNPYFPLPPWGGQG